MEDAKNISHTFSKRLIKQQVQTANSASLFWHDKNSYRREITTELSRRSNAALSHIRFSLFSALEVSLIKVFGLGVFKSANHLLVNVSACT